MLTKENVKQLVRGFLHESCGYLGIDDTQIGICYVPMPVSMMMVMLLKDSDDIVIDNKLLAAVVGQMSLIHICRCRRIERCRCRRRGSWPK